MRKIFVLLAFFITPIVAFPQDNDLPAFMVELDAGYAFGINVNSAVNFEVKLLYTYQRFGFVVEAGALISDNTVFHLFLGPAFFFINNEKWRVPVAVGFDLSGGKTLFYGMGGLVAVHYSITKNIYTGINLGVTYAFDNRYDELTGYRKGTYFYTDPDTGFVKEGTTDIPVFETKSHFGSYVSITPSIVIGFQF